MYWCAIGLGVGFIFCLFLMEETNYDRPHVETVDSPYTSPLQITTQHAKPEISSSEDPEKGIETTNPEFQVSDAASVPKTGTISYTSKSYLKKLSIVDKKRPFKILKLLPRPLILLSFPGIVYAGFSYGCALVWFNVLNATTSLILSAPPYNFSTSQVGLAYFAPLIGVALGSFYSGFIGDRLVLWLARRNNGVLESEHRLWIFTISLVLVPGNLISWGVGAAHYIHWVGLFSL
jgi:hypothetical protein